MEINQKRRKNNGERLLDSNKQKNIQQQLQRMQKTLCMRTRNIKKQ
jgi:hypothetical protein